MNKKKLVTTSLVGLLSSVLAFLGIIGCCGFPLLAAFLAWFGIGASQLSFFSEYQHLFTGIAIVALIYGFYTVYFKQTSSENTNDCCTAEGQIDGDELSCCTPSKGSGKVAKIMLWIGVVAVLSTFFMDRGNSQASVAEQGCCPVDVVEPVVEKPVSNSCCPGPSSEEAEQDQAPEKTSCCRN